MTALAAGTHRHLQHLAAGLSANRPAGRTEHYPCYQSVFRS